MRQHAIPMIVPFHRNQRIPYRRPAHQSSRQLERRKMPMHLRALQSRLPLDHLRARIIALGSAAGRIHADDVMPLSCGGNHTVIARCPRAPPLERTRRLSIASKSNTHSPKPGNKTPIFRILLRRQPSHQLPSRSPPCDLRLRQSILRNSFSSSSVSSPTTFS